MMEFKDRRENFQTQMINALRDGDQGVSLGLAESARPGYDFENTPANNVRAFIITPWDASVNGIEYLQEI